MITKGWTPAAIEAEGMEWDGQFRAPPEPEQPTRDDLRDLLAIRSGIKLEPLKTMSRAIIDFRKPAEAEAFLAAVLAENA